MKESRYNIFIEDVGKVLCYNSYTDAYLIISEQSYKSLKDEGPDKLRQQFGTTYEALIENGLIIDDEVDEIALIRMQNKREAFSSDIYHLMIYPTQDCNLKCWYCYETHVPNSKMSNSTLDSVLKHISKVCESRKYSSIRIVFFGGEPLLYYKSVVKPILVHSNNEVANNKMKLIPFFVTNASLLTEKIIMEMSVYSPLFQITLDGGYERHNKVRVWKGNKQRGTYEQIINAIKLISEVCDYNYPGISSITTIRINYDNNTLNDIVEIFNDLKDINKKKFFIHLERVWQTIGDRSTQEIEKLKNAVTTIHKYGFSVGFGIFGVKRVSCPAEVDRYAIINWDGSVYKCNGRTLIDKDKVGVLEKDGNISWNESKQAIRLSKATFENDMCLSCKMLPRCMGPCSQKQIELPKDKLNLACPLHSIDMSLKEYIRLNFELLLSNSK